MGKFLINTKKRRKFWENITKLLRNDCCKGFPVVKWGDV